MWWERETNVIYLLTLFGFVVAFVAAGEWSARVAVVVVVACAALFALRSIRGGLLCFTILRRRRRRRR